MLSLFRTDFISQANPEALEELMQGFRKDIKRLFWWAPIKIILKARNLGIFLRQWNIKKKLTFLYFNTAAFPEVLKILANPEDNCTEKKLT